MTMKSAYYMDTGNLPLASRASSLVRRKIFQLFWDVMRPSENTSILDLGVTSDEEHRESNFFEQLYPYKDRITCAGIEDASHVERVFPGTAFVPIAAGQKLPFHDGQFDVLFSNAVVEHAGSGNSQRFFISEALRVAKSFFITTPNRFFPVEMHTGLPLLHYLPKEAHRRVLANLGYGYWASESNLNLLGAREFRSLFPALIPVEIRNVKLLGIPSNLVAYHRI
jgi:hypothetical protein